MGSVKKHPPCWQIIAAFSQCESALEWVWERVADQLSPIHLLSSVYLFSESTYYRKTMGDELKKQFAVVSNWYDPANLPGHKLQMLGWEEELARTGSIDTPRPVNIDPGYMSMTKLVLASTKNREHRLYMRDGIYAEVTLAYRDQQWQPMPWTYPDYQREDFRLFFQHARQQLAKAVAEVLRNPSIPTNRDSKPK